MATGGRSALDPKVDIARQEDLKLSNWVDTLYQTEVKEELKVWYDAYSYQGFDRNNVLREMMKLGDTKLVAEIIVALALRGPVKGSDLKLSNGKTIQQIGIIVSNGKGSKKLSANKIIAATADLAAFYLKSLNVPKRVSSDLPGWLQFPSAGSIDMPENLRKLHKEFSEKFSKQIKGEFNEGIYEQMVRNAYLDKRLKLFRE